MSNDKVKKTAESFARAIGIPTAVALGIWGAYVASEIGAGREDPQAVVEREPDEYLAAEVDPGTGARVIIMKARRQHVRAGKNVNVPGLGRSIVLRPCGSTKQLANKCGDLFGPEKRCACCCPPGQFIVGDCVCGTDAGPSLCESTLPGTDAGMCNTSNVLDAGILCRYGKPQGSPDANAVCNPDAPGCEPWICVHDYGDNPWGIYKLDKSIDAGE